MPSNARILDDIARVAGGAASVISGLREQVSNDVKTRFEDMADRMDLVPRADLERVEAMLANIVRQQEEFEKRMEALEGNKKKVSK